MTYFCQQDQVINLIVSLCLTQELASRHDFRYCDCEKQEEDEGNRRDESEHKCVSFLTFCVERKRKGILLDLHWVSLELYFYGSHDVWQEKDSLAFQCLCCLPTSVPPSITLWILSNTHTDKVRKEGREKHGKALTWCHFNWAGLFIQRVVLQVHGTGQYQRDSDGIQDASIREDS